VSISSTFYAHFFADILVPKILNPKDSFVIFGTKISAQNVNEIDTCSQFHQHFMSSFFAHILAPKNYKAKM